MMKILLADDHALLRRGLKEVLLQEFPGSKFVEAGTTQETIDCLRRSACDLLILDVFMPGRTGLEVLEEVRRDHPGLPVLVFSAAPEDQMAARVLRAGASGFLNKRNGAEDLVQAVRKVLTGDKYIRADLAERLARERGRSRQLPHQRLSDRELHVMRLLISGKSVKEIANELALNVKTISTFHSRIRKKLDVKNGVELVHYAVEHSLVDHAGSSSAPEYKL